MGPPSWKCAHIDAKSYMAQDYFKTNLVQTRAMKKIPKPENTEQQYARSLPRPSLPSLEWIDKGFPSRSTLPLGAMG